MKNKLFIFTFFLFCVGKISAQEIRKHLYKGTIDKYPVTLYLIEEINGCPATNYSGIYKYDNMNQWIYLEISDDENSKLVMVESHISGIMSLKMNGNNLNGFWISPEGNKKLNVSLQRVKTTPKMIEYYDDKYEQKNHDTHDC